MTKYYNSGAIVKSIAGRERGGIFLIVNTIGNYAYLVNGKTRKVECPKKKNFKHLYLLEKNSNLQMDNVTNEDVIKLLNNYKKSIDYK